MKKEHLLKVALSQIAPVWLDKVNTIKKIESYITEASKNKTELIVFGEGLLPGYPFWLSLTEGAEWNTKLNKELHAHYVRNSVTIEHGDLNSICALAKKHAMAIYLGVIERPLDRGGHSVYASLVFIDKNGEIKSPKYHSKIF